MSRDERDQEGEAHDCFSGEWKLSYKIIRSTFINFKIMGIMVCSNTGWSASWHRFRCWGVLKTKGSFRSLSLSSFCHSLAGGQEKVRVRFPTRFRRKRRKKWALKGRQSVNKVKWRASQSERGVGNTCCRNTDNLEALNFNTPTPKNEGAMQPHRVSFNGDGDVDIY